MIGWAYDREWSMALDRGAKREKKALMDKREIRTTMQWNSYSNGSATCVTSSYERIYEAYHESRSYEEW